MSLASTNFSERLARIEKTSARGKSGVVLHVGDQELRVRSLEALRRSQTKTVCAPRAIHPLAFPVAIVIGMAGAALSVALRARFMTPELTAMIQDYSGISAFGAALVLAMVLGAMLRLSAMRLVLWQALGVMLALASLHNLAFWRPELSAQVFTPHWVAQQMAGQNPRTLVIGETRIEF
ncbi:hypothetical protein FGG78_06750 [Thioclava sp. BHET1]|nr:hypothetical protein FGG78_06750 [Thioclava sp. BHET1]